MACPNDGAADLPDYGLCQLFGVGGGDGMSDRIAIKFSEFHNSHPWVYRRLKELALDLKSSGVRYYGISGLYETLRYEASLRSRDEDGFKLNNNFAALYARMLVQDEPSLKEFFRFRMRKPRGTQSMEPEVDEWDRPI